MKRNMSWMAALVVLALVASPVLAGTGSPSASTTPSSGKTFVIHAFDADTVTFDAIGGDRSSQNGITMTRDDLGTAYDSATQIASSTSGNSYYVRPDTRRGEALAYEYTPVTGGEGFRVVFDAATVHGGVHTMIEPVTIGIGIGVGIVAAWLCGRGEREAMKACSGACSSAATPKTPLQKSSYSGGMCGFGGDCACSYGSL